MIKSYRNVNKKLVKLVTTVNDAINSHNFFEEDDNDNVDDYSEDIEKLLGLDFSKPSNPENEEN